MIRGIDTAASGMLARWNQMDVIANNLANVDTVGFKKDDVLLKAFPEMLIRRMKADGMVHFPLGSYDVAPVIGQLGTGVEVNDIQTRMDQGLNMKHTHNDFDIALEGKGFFVVESERGERYTRNGSFLVDDMGFLVTKEGFKVLGENGYIQVKHNNFQVDSQGRIVVNSIYNNQDNSTMIGREQNTFEYPEVLDRLKIVNFYDPRELVKEGHNYYKDSMYTGSPEILEEGNGRPKVLQGFLETSNVNPVLEMVKMISVQRNYEANSKVMTTHNQLLGRAVNEVGKIL